MEFRSLAGLTLPLVPSPRLRLAVPGRLEGRLAEVGFEVAQGLSSVTSGCVPAPRLVGQVALNEPLLPDQQLPVAQVAGLEVAQVALAPFPAALLPGAACRVTLGAPELRGLALEVRPFARTVRFRASQSRADWEVPTPGEERLVVALTAEPRFDWPLLPVRLVQGEAVLDAAFVLSTRQGPSRLAVGAAARSGLRLTRRPPSGARALAEEALVLDRLELGPGFGLEEGLLAAVESAGEGVALGVLGSDVWERFDTVVDVGAGVLVLARPRLATAGGRSLCDVGAGLDEASCFGLRTRALAGRGVAVTAALHRALPGGGRLYLDIAGTVGSCRAGFSFPPGGPGRSTQHVFPLGRAALPGCQAQLEGARGLELGLFEDGAHPRCPGLCAFMEDRSSGRVVCECQPGTDEAPAPRPALRSPGRLEEAAPGEPVDPP